MAINIQKENKWTYFLGILFFIMMVLLGLLATVVLVEFEGEILLIAENMWIGILFIILLLIEAFYTLFLTIRNHKQVKSKGIQLIKLDRNITWNMIWAILNIVIGCIIFYLVIYVQNIIAGLLGISLVSFQWIIIGILYFAAIYPIIASITWFARLINSIPNEIPEKPRLVRGMIGFALIFLFIGDLSELL